MTVCQLKLCRSWVVQQHNNPKHASKPTTELSRKRKSLASSEPFTSEIFIQFQGVHFFFCRHCINILFSPPLPHFFVVCMVAEADAWLSRAFLLHCSAWTHQGRCLEAFLSSGTHQRPAPSAPSLASTSSAFTPSQPPSPDPRVLHWTLDQISTRHQFSRKALLV